MIPYQPSTAGENVNGATTCERNPFLQHSSGMKKPTHVKAWNEDLKKALEVRYEQARREANGSIHTWRNGIEDIVRERRDIWVHDSTGNIHGMPLNFKTQTVRDLCYAIVQGREPIYPPCYQPMTVEEAQYFTEKQNPFLHDPFLKRMGKGGGSYAILMAFHHSQTKTLTRTEICRLGQNHCNEPMETNFLQGIMHAGISSLSTLSSHKLILTQREHLKESTYTLTRDGEQFTEALLAKFPPDDLLLSKTQEPRPSNPPPFTKDLSTYISNIKRRGTSRSMFKEQDMEELCDWCKSAPRFSIKKFKVGSDRRSCLHDICDFMTKEISGLQLRHRLENFDEEKYGTIQIILDRQPDIEISHEMISYLQRSIFPIPVAKRSLVGREKLKNNSHSLRVRKRHAIESTKSSSIGDDWYDVNSSSEDDEHHVVSCDIARSKPLSKVSVVLGKSLDGIWDSDDEEYEKNEAEQKTPPTKLVKPIFLALFESSDEGEGAYNRKLPSLACISNPVNAQRKLVNSFLESNAEERDNVKNNISGPESLSHAASAMHSKASAIATARMKKIISAQEVIILDDSEHEADIHEEKSKIKAPASPTVLHNGNETDSLMTQGIFSKTSEAAKGTMQIYEIIEIGESDDDKSNDFEFGESQQSTFDVIKPVSHDENDCYTQLTIVIDSRERNRDATPRELRIELTRHMTSGPIYDVWPKHTPTAIVEEAALQYGDYAFFVGNDLDTRRRLDIGVERKRISDIVSRSVKGDHWKQFTKMRDIFQHSIFLIEGDPKTAKGFSAYGHQLLEGRDPLMTIVEDEESLYCFFGKAILSHKSANFIQTKNEQGTHRAIGALGLMAISLDSICKDSSHFNASKGDKRAILSDRLTNAGVPWKLAQNIANEFGSVKNLELRYAQCESECCKAALMHPVTMFTHIEGDSRTSEALSNIVYRSFALPKSQLTDGTSSIMQKRHVNISLPLNLTNLFPETNDNAFFSLIVKESQGFFPKIAMKTFSGGQFESTTLFVFVVAGDEFVKRVQKSINLFPRCFVDAAKEVGASIRADCSTPSFRVDKDRMVVILRGLLPALDNISRHAGYRHEIRAVTDLVLANLILEHGVAIIQAIQKKKEQLRTIVQQLSLACFRYQLLTEVKVSEA